MNSRLLRMLGAGGALLVVAASLRPFEPIAAGDAANAVAEEEAAWHLLGGLRALVASGLWLRTNLAWEARDAAATRRLLDATVAADPRPLVFWFNGARMIAFDLREWSADPNAPAAVQSARRVAAARDALEFLGRAARSHPDSAELAVEIANLQLRGAGNRAEAARWFRVAALRPNAPAFAARVHAELLAELGQPEAARLWLESLLPHLSPHDPSHRRAAVEQRIKALEAMRPPP